MIKRFILVFVAIVCSLNMLGQVTISQEDYDKLPEEVKTQLEMSNTAKELKKYSEYAGIGKEIGIAVNETLEAVEDSAVRISETNVGKIAIFILVWNFLYKDILGIVLGAIFLIITIYVLFNTLKYLKEIRKDYGQYSEFDDMRFVFSVITCIVLLVVSMICFFS